MKTTRREFLSTSAMAVATLGATGIAMAAGRTTSPPVRLAIATYSYVNPLVAVLLGWLFADEVVGPSVLLAG